MKKRCKIIATAATAVALGRNSATAVSISIAWNWWKPFSTTVSSCHRGSFTGSCHLPMMNEMAWKYCTMHNALCSTVLSQFQFYYCRRGKQCISNYSTSTVVLFYSTDRNHEFLSFVRTQLQLRSLRQIQPVSLCYHDLRLASVGRSQTWGPLQEENWTKSRFVTRFL
jgi:hypothetical protein